MKKILNQAADFVPEMLDGLIKAHPDQLAYTEDIHCIVRACKLLRRSIFWWCRIMPNLWE